jgi:hypothetical protein
MADRPRMMYAAKMVPGIVIHSSEAKSWKGRTMTYTQVIWEMAME